MRPSPLCDYTKLQRDLRDAYQSARESGLDAHAAFECALDEAIPGVRGESLPRDEKIAPRLPDTFVERAIQVARANPGEPDVFVMLTVFEAAYIREKYVERNRPASSGTAVGRVGGEEP